MLNTGHWGGVSFLTLALLGGTCFAQSPEAKEPARFYRLDFAVKEVDGGKVVNSRTYSTTASTEAPRGCAIRTNSRVRVPEPSSSQTSSIEVGVSIDCGSLRELQNELSLSVTADISSMAQESTPPSSYPVIRQNRWSSTVAVPLKKPTVIFSSDDATTKRQMQVELTATPVP